MKFLYPFLLLLTLPCLVSANTIDTLLEEYRQQGTKNFNAESGKQLWLKPFTDKKTGEVRDCTNCHTSDLTKPGKHIRTGKPIKPMSPSVNPERLTNIKKMKKWFKRNCKWTLGRECNAQEKGDILLYLQSQ